MSNATIEPKIDARKAANAAAAYFANLYPDTKSFSLEEIELTEDGSYWHVTLSFDVPRVLKISDALLPFQPPTTKFKVFKVDSRTGKVVAMKIRKLE